MGVSLQYVEPATLLVRHTRHVVTCCPIAIIRLCHRSYNRNANHGAVGIIDLFSAVSETFSVKRGFIN
jgi:hypothetical protein